MSDDIQPDEEAWERLFTQLDDIAALQRCYDPEFWVNGNGASLRT